MSKAIATVDRRRDARAGPRSGSSSFIIGPPSVRRGWIPRPRAAPNRRQRTRNDSTTGNGIPGIDVRVVHADDSPPPAPSIREEPSKGETRLTWFRVNARDDLDDILERALAHDGPSLVR